MFVFVWQFFAFPLAAVKTALQIWMSLSQYKKQNDFITCVYVRGQTKKIKKELEMTRVCKEYGLKEPFNQLRCRAFHFVQSLFML